MKLSELLKENWKENKVELKKRGFNKGYIVLEKEGNFILYDVTKQKICYRYDYTKNESCID